MGGMWVVRVGFGRIAELMVVRIFNRKYLLLIGQGCCRVLLVTLRAPLPTIMCRTGRSTYMPGNVRGI